MIKHAKFYSGCLRERIPAVVVLNCCVVCCRATVGTARLQLAMLGSYGYGFNVFLVLIIQLVTILDSIHKPMVELAFVMVMLHIEKSTTEIK